MLDDTKAMFRKFFTSIKENRIVKKILKFIVPTIAIVASAVAIYFGLKSRKLKTMLDMTEMILSQTKSALYATSAQATQLTLDNEVLSELLGMVIRAPGNMFA